MWSTRAEVLHDAKKKGIIQSRVRGKNLRIMKEWTILREVACGALIILHIVELHFDGCSFLSIVSQLNSQVHIPPIERVKSVKTCLHLLASFLIPAPMTSPNLCDHLTHCSKTTPLLPPSLSINLRWVVSVRAKVGLRVVRRCLLHRTGTGAALLRH